MTCPYLEPEYLTAKRERCSCQHARLGAERLDGLLLCRIDHKIKGQGLYAYITLHDGVKWGDALVNILPAVVCSIS